MAPKRSVTIIAAWIGFFGVTILAIGTLAVPFIQKLLNNSSQEIEYIGRVIDNSSQIPIAGAKITLDLQGVPPIVYTDSEGVYRFKVEINSNISGQVRVDAQDYQTYTRYITLFPEVQTIEDIRLNSVQQTPATETLVLPTSTIIASSAPIVDSIEFPPSIVCDGRKYNVPIRFHDFDGDAHRIQWELLYSKKQTPLYADAIEFAIDSQTQKQGATFNDFIQWYIPGDEVKIRVYVEDRTEQNGFMDFEFKCSN